MSITIPQHQANDRQHDRAGHADPIALAEIDGGEIVDPLAVVHALQALGILPYFLGPIAYRNFNLWYDFT